MKVYKYVVMIMFFALLIIGLNYPNINAGLGDKTNTQKVGSSIQTDSGEGLLMKFRMSPLEYSKFNDIINNIEQFTVFWIDYSEYQSDPENEHLHNITIFVMEKGDDHLKAITYNSTQEFKAGLHRINQIENQNEHFQHVFTDSEVNSILNYLVSNHEYFFSGEEYPEYPFESRCLYIQKKKYNFVLDIFDPLILDPNYREDNFPVWSINKSTDDPDEIFQGLIDILEEDFISQFGP